LRRVRETIPEISLALDLNQFNEETNQLVVEAQALHDQESQFRADLAAVNEERQVWADHVAMLEAAIAELDATFSSSLKHSPDVECPMCGQHYQNHIADQFELVADKDDLINALLAGRTYLRDANAKISAHRAKLEGISAAIAKIDRILAVRKSDISLRDVVASEGRNEAQRVLRERLSALDADVGARDRSLKECEARMREVDSPSRKSSINGHFGTKLRNAAEILDVRLPEIASNTLQGVNIGRGSEGPRALAAYYYAFLSTADKFGSSVFCPIVVDAPNQQGQDARHLESILRFLFSNPPQGSQVIVGTETITEGADAHVIDVSWKKDQVLREDSYEEVAKYLNQFLRQLIL